MYVYIYITLTIRKDKIYKQIIYAIGKYGVMSNRIKIVIMDVHYLTYKYTYKMVDTCNNCKYMP